MLLFSKTDSVGSDKTNRLLTHIPKLLLGLFPRFPSSPDRFQLSQIMTLLLLVVIPQSVWFVKIPTAILCIIGIVLPEWRKNVQFWLVLFSLLIFECYYLWFIQDNHKYLISYWCLAVGISLSSQVPQEVLCKSARILIGLCFGFAVLAKCISPSYMNGDFFYIELQNDSRFHPVSKMVAGMPDEVIIKNQTTISEMFGKMGPVHLESTIESIPMLVSSSWFLTIWTLIIEVLIAVAFLVPVHWWLSKIRNYTLILFIFSTYAIANVIGFGWVLAVLGISQLKDREHYHATIYFMLIILLHVYRVPWFALIWN